MLSGFLSLMLRTLQLSCRLYYEQICMAMCLAWAVFFCILLKCGQFFVGFFFLISAPHCQNTVQSNRISSTHDSVKPYMIE